MTLICHAATSAVRAADFPNDEVLDVAGLRAAGALAADIGRVDRAWVSPAVRAQQTAQALGLAAVTETALRACDYGRWTGRTLAEVQALDGEAAVLSWLTDPAAAPHGGEAVLDVLDRVGGWLDSRAQDEGHSVAVSHPEVVRAAIVHAIQASPAAFARIDVGPLSRVVLSYNRGWRLRAIAPATGI